MQKTSPDRKESEGKTTMYEMCVHCQNLLITTDSQKYPSHTLNNNNI